jgi:SPP1 family predicted phage head-tail adaptor
MIGQMNRRITIKSWAALQDAGGGVSAAVVGSYTIWAKVEARSGALYTSEEQALWNYDYKVTFRYERTRVVQSNMTIDYDLKRLRINSLSFIEEGNRKYCIARCTTTDATIDVFGDVIGNVADLSTSLQTYDYYGVDGELSFTNTDLIGATIIGAFKDGIEYAVILSGTPTGKQVLYNSLTGQFTWSTPFEPGEHSLIQFLG